MPGRMLFGSLGLFASGLFLVAGTVWQAGRLDASLPPWASGKSLNPRRWSAPSPKAPQAIAPNRVVAEGRVVAYPGAEVVVGTEVAGRIVALSVDEKSVVHKGDLIAELNAADLRAERAEAEARIAEAEADMRFYQRELQREEALLISNHGTRQNLDSHRRALDAARARRAGAIASRDRCAALIDKTRILAPISGVVTARHAQPGETIEASARLVTIVDLDRLRIEAEVDEFDTAGVAIGAHVAISAEGYATRWPGAVEEVPDSVVGRRLRPEDSGRPIDARVLPVKIALRAATPLKLGQRVEVEIATTQGVAMR
jgi:HlyD family secretion protein